MSRILVIDDEAAINRMICMNLDILGHETVSAYDGKEVIKKLNNAEKFDIALLDVMLPHTDGFELLPILSGRGIPVIFLTARGDLESKLKGLMSGAEDYIVKPFEMPELIVRIEKVLLRTGRADTLIKAGDVVINTEERSVRKNDVPLPLTPIEYDLLLLLTRNKNIALSREKLLSDVWGILYEGGTRTVDVHIAQLRKKTQLNIVTIPKTGYRLEDDK